MYIHKITLKIDSDADRSLIIENFSLLQDFYRGNGQTIGTVQLEYHEKSELICMPYTLESDSLSIQNNNFYVNKQIEVLETLCKAKLQINLHGTIGTGQYKFEINELYILKTDYTTLNSPLLNINGWGIPLYRLPPYYDHGYMPMIQWETNYKACDNLFMDGEVGEKWALNELQYFKSALSKQGRHICLTIEKMTNTPTYYYLFNYRKKDILHCPSCNQSWIPENIFGGFDFRCDPCRLISNKTLY